MFSIITFDFYFISRTPFFETFIYWWAILFKDNSNIIQLSYSINHFTLEREVLSIKLTLRYSRLWWRFRNCSSNFDVNLIRGFKLFLERSKLACNRSVFSNSCRSFDSQNSSILVKYNPHRVIRAVPFKLLIGTELLKSRSIVNGFSCLEYFAFYRFLFFIYSYFHWTLTRFCISVNEIILKPTVMFRIASHQFSVLSESTLRLYFAFLLFIKSIKLSKFEWFYKAGFELLRDNDFVFALLFRLILGCLFRFSWNQVSIKEVR